jgi:uracil-DNA glycosylase
MMGVASLTMTGRVKAWRDVAPKLMPLPHPSWRVVGWMKKNRWFEQELLPFLKTTVQTALG